MLGFLGKADTGQPATTTFAQIAQKRRQADALMSGDRPQTAIQGLGAIAKGVLAGRQRRQANAAEERHRSEFQGLARTAMEPGSPVAAFVSALSHPAAKDSAVAAFVTEEFKRRREAEIEAKKPKERKIRTGFDDSGTKRDYYIDENGKAVFVTPDYDPQPDFVPFSFGDGRAGAFDKTSGTFGETRDVGPSQKQRHEMSVADADALLAREEFEHEKEQDRIIRALEEKEYKQGVKEHEDGLKEEARRLEHERSEGQKNRDSRESIAHTRARGDAASGGNYLNPAEENAWDSSKAAFEQIDAADLLADEAIKNLTVMGLQLPDMQSGTLQGALNFIKGVAHRVALNDGRTLTANQIFNQYSNKQVLIALGGDLGHQISDADREFIKQTVPQETHTKEAIAKGIAIARRMADVAKRKAEAKEVWRLSEGASGFYKGEGGFERYWAENGEELFPKEWENEFKRIHETGATKASSNAEIDELLRKYGQ